MAEQNRRPPFAVNLVIAGFAAVALYDLLLNGIFTAQGQILPPQVWRGEWFRLFGSMFLHANAIHFVVDACVLMVLGIAAEKVYGRSRVLLVFVLSALVAGLTTVVLRPGDVAFTSSGGTAGLAGLLAGLVTFRSGALPDEVENRVKMAVAGMIVLLVGLSFAVPEANVAMHFGGLLAGLFLATGLETEVPSAPRPVVAIPAAAILIVGGVLLGQVPAEQRSIETLVGSSLRAQELSDAGRAQDAIQILETSLSAGASGSADRLGLPIAQNQLAWYYVETVGNLERALDLSLESNNRVEDQPAFLDTLGYVYALLGRCREANDAMTRAAGANTAYEARRVEVARACAVGQRPDTAIPVKPPEPVPTPAPKGDLGA